MAKLVGFIRSIGTVAFFPIRAALSIRRSMTGGSVSLLLVFIISFNIVWGYPWTGVFSASAAMLLTGFLINRLFRPNLSVNVSLPDYAPEGEPFQADLHLHHRGWLPSFDLALSVTKPRRRDKAIFSSDSGSVFIDAIESGGRCDTELSLCASRRGIHTFPRLQATTTFPFHFFQTRQMLRLRARIAVTPKPINDANDPKAARCIDQISRWTDRWLSGESFEFAGNREYQTGMPVRRWDFRSWARLGRPIVQEFQTPSLRKTMIIVDTASDRDRSEEESREELEYLLRVVATSINYWTEKSVAMRMFVTSEAVADFDVATAGTVPNITSLMVQLARADQIEQRQANARIGEIIERFDIGSTVLFTNRNTIVYPGQRSPNLPELKQHINGLPANVQVIQVASEASQTTRDDYQQQTPSLVDGAHQNSDLVATL